MTNEEQRLRAWLVEIGMVAHRHTAAELRGIIDTALDGAEPPVRTRPATPKELAHLRDPETYA